MTNTKKPMTVTDAMDLLNQIDTTPGIQKKRIRKKKETPVNIELIIEESASCNEANDTVMDELEETTDTPSTPVESVYENTFSPPPSSLYLPDEPIEIQELSQPQPPVIINIPTVDSESNLVDKNKKRGRKSKGGKLIHKSSIHDSTTVVNSNIILHLKCSLKDIHDYDDYDYIHDPLKYNPSIPPEIMMYNENDTQFTSYNEDHMARTGHTLASSSTTMSTPASTGPFSLNTDNRFAYKENICSKCYGSLTTTGKGYSGAGATTTAGTTTCATTGATATATAGAIISIDNGGRGMASNVEREPSVISALKPIDSNTVITMKPGTQSIDDDEPIDIKDVNTKLKQLRIQLYKNEMHEKKSACFWCTYEFDNPPSYILKYEMDGTICGYGSFCRPECGVGFLMKEPIDDSTKFERYQLMNQIYGKVYGYKKNIKPAPNPYYLLDKYYGNLSIQQYRKLLKTEHMLLVIDKPLTRILPELHDDNDEFILNIYGGGDTKSSQSRQTGGGVYKVKRQSEKKQGPTKNSIIRDKFGLNN